MRCPTSRKERLQCDLWDPRCSKLCPAAEPPLRRAGVCTIWQKCKIIKFLTDWWKKLHMVKIIIFRRTCLYYNCLHSTSLNIWKLKRFSPSFEDVCLLRQKWPTLSLFESGPEQYPGQLSMPLNIQTNAPNPFRLENRNETHLFIGKCLKSQRWNSRLRYT